MIKILMLLVFLFTVAGICEFVYILRMVFFHPNIRVKHYSLVVLKSGYAIKQLNYIWQKIKWHGDSFALGIIAIIDDIDQNEFSACENFIKEKNILLCNSVFVVPNKDL